MCRTRAAGGLGGKKFRMLGASPVEGMDFAARAGHPQTDRNTTSNTSAFVTPRRPLGLGVFQLVRSFYYRRHAASVTHLR